MKFIFHSFLLIASFGIVFVIEIRDKFLSDYTIPILAFLVLVYTINTFIKRKLKQSNQFFFAGDFEIFILTTAILLLIFSTNALYSPFIFFMLYFLSFGIAIAFEPLSVFTFTICCIAIFIPEVIKNGSTESYIRLGSLIFSAPLAFFFGQIFRDRTRKEKQVKDLKSQTIDATKTIEDDITDVLENETLNPKSEVKLEKAADKARDLRKKVNN